MVGLGGINKFFIHTLEQIRPCVIYDIITTPYTGYCDSKEMVWHRD